MAEAKAEAQQQDNNGKTAISCPRLSGRLKSAPSLTALVSAVYRQREEWRKEKKKINKMKKRGKNKRKRKKEENCGQMSIWPTISSVAPHSENALVNQERRGRPRPARPSLIFSNASSSFSVSQLTE